MNKYFENGVYDLHDKLAMCEDYKLCRASMVLGLILRQGKSGQESYNYALESVENVNFL
jgi:hypothetical protein